MRGKCLQRTAQLPGGKGARSHDRHRAQGAVGGVETDWRLGEYRRWWSYRPIRHPVAPDHPDQ